MHIADIERRRMTAMATMSDQNRPINFKQRFR